MALSSTKDEYVAVTSASTQALWLRKVLKDIGEEKTQATIIFCDKKVPSIWHKTLSIILE